MAIQNAPQARLMGMSDWITDTVNDIVDGIADALDGLDPEKWDMPDVPDVPDMPDAVRDIFRHANHERSTRKRQKGRGA